MSYAEDEEDIQSVTGMVMIGGAPNLWPSGTQPCATPSSTETEFLSLADCTKDTPFLKLRLTFLTPGSPIIRVEISKGNEAVIRLGSNLILKNSTKHVDVRHQYFRDSIKEGKIELDHVRPQELLHNFSRKLGVRRTTRRTARRV